VPDVPELSGLVQAFLVAGANALSLSLWQVSDRSTQVFMTSVYRSAEREQSEFAQAMTGVKRLFIASDSVAHPFFRAPFVYYGR